MFRDFELDRIRYKTDLINWLGWQAGYTSYLEVATETTGLMFGLISRDVFSSADRVMYRLHPKYDDGLPIWHRTALADSTECFRALEAAGRTFDLVFVDSYHTYESSRRDLELALERLQPGGTVVVHDCRPAKPELATPSFKEGSWLGVTYLAFLDLVNERPDLEYCVVDLDTGCGILRPRRHVTADRDRAAVDPAPARRRPPALDYRDWSVYMANQREILNLVSVNQFLIERRVRPIGLAAWSYHRLAPVLEATGALDHAARMVGRIRRRMAR